MTVLRSLAGQAKPSDMRKALWYSLCSSQGYMGEDGSIKFPPSPQVTIRGTNVLSSSVAMDKIMTKRA